MYQALLVSHSYLRYVVLILLIVVIITSLIGWVNRKPFTATDNKLGLFLMIFTHIQVVLGLILFFISPAVQFSGESMKNAEMRHWLVEHNTGMLIAVVLITVARSTSKRMTESVAKHRRLFIFNLIALVIILVMISMSGRGMLLFR